MQQKQQQQQQQQQQRRHCYQNGMFVNENTNHMQPASTQPLTSTRAMIRDACSVHLQ
jgi:hypothetical protein